MLDGAPSRVLSGTSPFEGWSLRGNSRTCRAGVDPARPRSATCVSCPKHARPRNHEGGHGAQSGHRRAFANLVPERARAGCLLLRHCIVPGFPWGRSEDDLLIVAACRSDGIPIDLEAVDRLGWLPESPPAAQPLADLRAFSPAPRRRWNPSSSRGACEASRQRRGGKSPLRCTSGKRRMSPA